MANKKRSLTVKQRTFAEYYVLTGNATRSYIEAYGKNPEKQYNYAATEGHKLLKHPLVREYIEELTRQRSPLANEAWIIDKLLELISDPNAKDADKLKAYDMMLKCLGAYTTNVNANVTGEQTIVVTIEDDDEDEEDDTVESDKLED